ncbi:hypothetical protein SCLCIDRAFT_1217860 [Scleroderma citrinum Foug A]|uniref:Uncharacterized protein n=1 Tax=Scleroderma citrinum Foug A TaxID=1036808 RepID=A0A0C3DF09_9AGAM|nr:hypothetical protein SCLCIDRAFT_1217860 [Scleroderma citrinum Foug A]
MVSRCPTENGNTRIKKPSDHVLRAISERAASMANVYKAMKLSGTEGRLLFKQVKDMMINSKIDFDTPLVMQKKTELKKLKKQISKNVPYFNRYEDHWPVDVIMERHFHYHSRLSTNQIVVEHLSTHEPEAGTTKSTATTNLEGLGRLHHLLASTNTFHLSLALMRAGLTDTQQFQNFLNMPSCARKSFLSFSLQGYAEPHEIDAIHAATKNLED